MEKKEKRILRALVVDDSEVNTLILANMLELFDVAADQTNCGTQAVAMIHELTYDIIFIDHIMPDMNGLETTRVIRNLSTEEDRIVIIVLTSNVTEEIYRLYLEAGANDVFAKPLGLMELTQILKQWCSWLSIEEKNDLKLEVPENQEEQLIRAILQDLREINYEAGLRYALGDSKHYVEILRVALKDIRTCMDMTKKGYHNHKSGEMNIGVHNIKSVFTNIGASELAEYAKRIEQLLIARDEAALEENFFHYVQRIEIFYLSLEQALVECDMIAKRIKLEEEVNYTYLTGEEYEQSIRDTIYYIERYDYVAIINELELLQERGNPEYCVEIEAAMTEIRNYQYERTLQRLINIKKEIERSSDGTSSNPTV